MGGTKRYTARNALISTQEGANVSVRLDQGDGVAVIEEMTMHSITPGCATTRWVTIPVSLSIAPLYISREQNAVVPHLTILTTLTHFTNLLVTLTHVLVTPANQEQSILAEHPRRDPRSHSGHPIRQLTVK